MLMYPVDIISGRVDGLDSLALVGVQVAWLAGVALLGQVLTRAGRRHLEVQGG
jgi:ABC-2 type transport system permease protein